MSLPKERIATHPGEVLLEEYIKPLGLTQAALAKDLGISTNRLNELVRGKRGITADTALRLARRFGTSPGALDESSDCVSANRGADSDGGLAPPESGQRHFVEAEGVHIAIAIRAIRYQVTFNHTKRSKKSHPRFPCSSTTFSRTISR